jgi:adenylate cyclase
MAKSQRYNARPVNSLLIVAGAVLLALIIGQLTPLENLELSLLDYRFKIRGTQSVVKSPIVILAIDDQSDESTPARWPWPRSYYAHVIENLNKAGVKAIGIDVIFDQADQNGQQSDSLLAEALSKYKNVVLAGKIDIPGGRTDMATLVQPYQIFRQQKVHWGLVSFDLDQDGFYRRYLIGQTHQTQVGDTFIDSLYSSFAVELLRVYKDIPAAVTLTDNGSFFQLDTFKIPKINSYSTLINYAGPVGTFRQYSFDAVLDDENFDLIEEYDLDAFSDIGDPANGIPPGLLYSGDLKDKIVLIGSTMKELHDDFPTPFLEGRDAQGHSIKVLTNGVEIHANTLNMILNQQYLQQISFWWQIAILVLLAIIVYFLTRFLPTLWGMLITIIIALAYFALAFVSFSSWSTIIEISTPLLAIAFAYLGQTVYQYIQSQKEKRWIQDAFSHYVPAKVVKEIVKNPDKLKLGGEEQVVTVLFSDIAGFTPLSEKMTPAELVHLLNEYLTEMTDIILANEGIIDKYEGDAIMAEFGIPVNYANHPYMACKAALQMQQRLKFLRQKWQDAGKPVIRARVGLNTGNVIVGNMGSRDVLDYTVMGDNVNLGARLESANKFYGTSIMISDYTYEYVKNDFYTRELDLIRVVGKEKAIKVHELIAFKDEKLSDNFMKLLEKYQEGLQFYKTQQWDKAINAFEACLQLVPDDTPSAEYRTRCIEYKFNSPGPDWDGVTDLKGK